MFGSLSFVVATRSFCRGNNLLLSWPRDVKSWPQDLLLREQHIFLVARSLMRKHLCDHNLGLSEMDKTFLSIPRSYTSIN